MKTIKSQRHHWWPECVSALWADEQGGIHRLSPDGSVRRAAPRNFGVIGNGHTVKLSDDPSVTTPFDECFESEFQSVDSNFRSVVNFLNSSQQDSPAKPQLNSVRVRSHPISDEMFNRISSCVISLAVRSPLFRERSVRLAENFRGPLPERERNRLIGTNIRRSFRDATRLLEGRGILLAIHSNEAEFIFGDGFYNDIPVPVQHLSNITLLAPITPSLAVLYALRPTQAGAERFYSIHITQEEVILLNNSIQAYSSQEVFFRKNQPTPTAEFRSGKHMRYSDEQNPVDSLVMMIPAFRFYFSQILEIKRKLWWLL